MTTSHLVLLSSLVHSSLLARLRPLPHPPQVGGGDGETEVDVRVLVQLQVQLLQVLRRHRQDLHWLLLDHHEVGPLPVEAVHCSASTGRGGGRCDQGTQGGAGAVPGRVQLLLRQNLSPGLLPWLLL